LWPFLVLIGLPTAIFLVPDLADGKLLMAGDNIQQNYPLHVLVGDMLRHGQLPFWNKYIFSGTPLLAGFNAGAFYPLIGLFAILPDRAAWIATEAILFSSIGVGMYAFLRTLKLSTMACFLGAFTYTFAGTVFSQVNHVDMTEGFAALPWMLLAVHLILRDGKWRWSIVLGIGFATVIFGGAPEAMLDEAILVLAYAAISAWGDRQRWWRLVTRAGTGAGLALSLAAIQWLPGLSAIANSQRGGVGGSFAAAGSYPTDFGLFSLVPYLFGGYNNLGSSSFFGQYNLPEVEIYLGVLPIIALVALLHPRWPSRLAGSERRTWYLVGLLGLLLALGSNTPLEHLFNAIPLYGHQRLQSRNMIDVSTAVCVLFAGWLDRRDEPQPSLVRYERAVALVPAGVVGALMVWALASPSSLINAFSGGGSITAVHERSVRVTTLIALAFCVTAAAVVWLRSRVARGTWIRWAMVFVLADVGLIAGSGQLLNVPNNAYLSGNSSIEQYLAANLPPGGRFDVFDPQQYNSGYYTGLPDLNILAGLPSVGGYASIVNGNYSTVTNTHTVGALNVPELDSGNLDDLDLQEIITLPEYFLVPVVGAPRSLGAVQQLSVKYNSNPVLPRGNAAAFEDAASTYVPGPRPSLAAGQSTGWFFGESLSPSDASLLFAAPAPLGVVRFGIVTGDGHTDWGPAVKVASGASSVTGALPRHGDVEGVAVQVLFGHVPSFQGMVTVDGQRYELDGSLSTTLRPGVWRQIPSIQGYSVLLRLKGATPLYTLTRDGGRGASAKVLESQTKVEKVRVKTGVPLTVVRDVAWDAGWRGSVQVNGGPARSVPVSSHGLVQAIKVPPGEDLVTFTYTPPHFLLGSILSVGSVGVLLIVFVVWLFRRRRVPAA
jgi:hypothetical protein